MKFEDGWHWPDSETHMNAWIANPKNRLMLNGRPAYQGKKQVALLNLCLGRRMAIDIGAHIGTWAYNLAAEFQNVRCFEPMAAHRECLLRNVEADNVIVYPIALGETSSLVAMASSDISTGDTWVDPDNVGDVQMEKLDSFGFIGVDLIKIDAEGFEEKILRGASSTIARCNPVICVEQKRDFPKKYGMQPQGAVRYLESLGYVVAKEIGGDYIMLPSSERLAA